MRRLFILLALMWLVACAAPLENEVTVASLPSTTPTLAPSPTTNPAPSFSLIFHPDGALYVGDQVSIEIVAPPGFDIKGTQVEVLSGEQKLGAAGFAPFGIGGRNQATLWWIWDTSALAAGSHTLTISVTPDGPIFQSTLNLLPASERPTASWKMASSECCTLNYLSGTEAERDIEELKQIADSAAERVSQKLGPSKEKIPVIFIPRVLGQGGFTTDSIYVSYLDRNYAGNASAHVLEHEMVHWFDALQKSDLRPSILQEGLAVYLTGGHFKIEPIAPRAAVLLETKDYIPLRKLSDQFYLSQHETGYMEAAALVQYLVETYGWDQFNAFYHDIHPALSGSQADAIDAALKAHFELTFEQLEANYLDYLHAQPIDNAIRANVRLSIQFFDTARRYQKLFDPSAYFQTAWLADASVMRQRGIDGDYLRHPDTSLNRYLEGLLVDADASLRTEDYAKTEQQLHALNVMLDILENTKR